jgi:hypothetical protein
VPSRAGSPNKNKQALIALLEQKYPGYQPVLCMAEGAQLLTERAREATEQVKGIKQDDAIKDVVIMRQFELEAWQRANAENDRVAVYITPKLKAVEVNLDVQGDIKIGWSDTHGVQSETVASDIA